MAACLSFATLGLVASAITHYAADGERMLTG
jgi:hypothetical protein